MSYSSQGLPRGFGTFSQGKGAALPFQTPFLPQTTFGAPYGANFGHSHIATTTPVATATPFTSFNSFNGQHAHLGGAHIHSAPVYASHLHAAPAHAHVHAAAPHLHVTPAWHTDVHVAPHIDTHLVGHVDAHSHGHAHSNVHTTREVCTDPHCHKPASTVHTSPLHIDQHLDTHAHWGGPAHIDTHWGATACAPSFAPPLCAPTACAPSFASWGASSCEPTIACAPVPTAHVDFGHVDFGHGHLHVDNHAHGVVHGTVHNEVHTTRTLCSDPHCHEPHTIHH